MGVLSVCASRCDGFLKLNRLHDLTVKMCIPILVYVQINAMRLKVNAKKRVDVKFASFTSQICPRDAMPQKHKRVEILLKSLTSASKREQAGKCAGCVYWFVC